MTVVYVQPFVECVHPRTQRKICLCLTRILRLWFIRNERFFISKINLLSHILIRVREQFKMSKINLILQIKVRLF